MGLHLDARVGIRRCATTLGSKARERERKGSRRRVTKIF
jgi:hypothetical protein